MTHDNIEFIVTSRLDVLPDFEASRQSATLQQGYNLFIFPVFRCLYKGAIMAIRIICKNCGSKIEAKDELLGQTRQCPKCKSPILIVPTENIAQSLTPHPSPLTPVQGETVTAQPADETPIMFDNSDRLPTHDPPTKLSPNCRYFVFAHDRMIAHWEIGKGWQYNTGHGFVSARVNKDLLPNSGTFKFVEMIIEQQETGKRLSGIRTFSIGGKWAISAIGREPEEILAKIDGKAVMTKPQRMQLLAFIRQHYMAEFLQNAKEVYEYLVCEFTKESDVFVHQEN